MFLIGSIIIVVVLVLLRTTIDVTDVLEKKRFLEAGVEKAEFENIRSEISKSAFNAVNASQNMTNATNSFISFAELRLAARTIDLDGVSVISNYRNLTASTDTPLNVTVLNFFDTDLERVVLNLSTDFSSPVTFLDVGPGTTRSNQFTLNLASTTNLTLWVYYETPVQKVQQNITVPANIDQSRFVGYFDARMESERGSVRDRFVEEVDTT